MPPARTTVVRKPMSGKMALAAAAILAAVVVGILLGLGTTPQ